jgi:hypothetical protein
MGHLSFFTNAALHIQYNLTHNKSNYQGNLYAEFFAQAKPADYTPNHISGQA